MEQALAVEWTEDTWTDRDEDLASYYPGGPGSKDPEGAAMQAMMQARERAILKHRGAVLSTCWVPFQGIVATVKCDDGQIRDVRTSQLRSAS